MRRHELTIASFVALSSFALSPYAPSPLAMSSAAAAPPGMTELPAESLTEPSGSVEYKDPRTATLLALGASVAGIGGIYLGSTMHEHGDTPIMTMGALIALVGPSAGAWWAHDSPRLTPGLGIRFAGAAIMGVGLAVAVDSGCFGASCDAPLQSSNSDFLIGIGAAVAVGGMVYEIATAGREAVRHNARATTRYSLGPQLVPTSRGTAPGLGIAGSF